MSIDQSFPLEILAYILLLLMLYTIVRFLATSMTNLLKGIPEDQDKVVNPFINTVHYPVSYWTEKGGRPYQEDRHSEMKGNGRDDSSLYGVFDGNILSISNLTT